MRPAGLLLLAGAALVAWPGIASAQRAGNWRIYRMTDGLSESACSSVTIGSQGRVVVKHANAPFISELDGYTVNSVPSAEAGYGRAYESPGGQLWCVVPEGLREFQDGTWVLHRVPEIAEQFRGRQPPAIPLWPIRQGLVLVLLPDRLLEFTSDGTGPDRVETLRTAAQSGLERFNGMDPAADGSLWLAGTRGLAKAPGPLRNLRPTSEWHDYLIPDSLGLHNLRGPHEAGDAGMSALGDSLTNDQASLVVFDGQSWSAHSTGSDRVRQAWRGSDKTCWAVTPEALLQWDMDQPEVIENEEVSARQYFDAAVERGGAFWLATSDGLVRYAPSAWRTPGSVRGLNSLIHCIAADQDGRVWFIAGGTLHSLLNDRRSEHPLSPRAARVLSSARALYPLKNAKVLIESGDGLFEIETGLDRLRPLSGEPGTERARVLGVLKEGSVAVQRSNPAGGTDLAVYDGIAFGPFPYPLPERAIGANLSSLLVTQNGDLWASGELGTAWFHEQKWRSFISTDHSTPQAALGFIEMPEGKLWCAAQDRIWEFDGRNWSAIRRGFDRIQALLRSRRDGSVWVASNNGVHRFAPSGAWVENGPEEGLAANSIRCLAEDSAGRLWAGTAHGLSLYYPDADTDPPKTQIEPLPDSEKKILEGHTVTLIFSSQDKWKYTSRSRLLYSYRLDTHDWSAFQEGSSVSFPDLPAGKHYFEVRAMDRNCNVEPKAAQLEFVIALPWYREKRLVMISAAGLAAVIFFAGLAFNRHHQLRLSYAQVEKQIAERTRELERANRELLHSQKMNALGALAAGIAHDFNNILSIIKGSAQIIEDNLENPNKIRTRVDRIKTVVEQGAGIVKAMLGFSRDSDQDSASCALNAAVEDTIKLLGDRFLREVQVRFEPGPDLPDVACSKDFVQQILLNFIFNAAESMAERKDVVIETRPIEKLPTSLILAPAGPAPYAAISVRDHGCGIPPENLTRIFEPFFTTKALSARRGTGLGLSMVYELARKMQAGLAVESVVGEGSAFTLILPLVRDEVQPDAKRSVLAQKSE